MLQEQITAGQFSLNPVTYRLITPTTKVVKLTRLETRLLALLMSYAEHAISTERIIEHLWNYTGDTSALKSLIHRLRKKIEPDPKQPVHLQRMGEGYVFFA